MEAAFRNKPQCGYSIYLPVIKNALDVNLDLMAAILLLH